MTNDEFPMTKEIQKPNDEVRTAEKRDVFWTFALRASDFVIVQSPDSIAECGVRNSVTDNGRLTTDNPQPTTAT